MRRGRGRPPKLNGEHLADALEWEREGVTRRQIARRLGVHPSTVTRTLGARR